MKHRIILLAIAALAAFEAAAARPRLVVNIVVGSMRAEDLGRYAGNYGEGGLRRLLDGGTVFADSRYDYQQTTTPVSLATLTTGAMPSTHGVIGARWRDYVENDAVELIAGRKGPGPYNLIAPTLAEALLQHEPGAKAVSVATEAMSAVIMAGHGGEAFWLDSARCGWETSPYYAPEVPEWVARSNRERYNLSYITPEWRTLYEKGRYLNTRNWDIVLTGKSRKDKDEPGEGRLKLTSDYDKMLYTPAGNTAVLGFAKQAIAQFKLGDDATPDLLNICLDTPRRISEAYGPESVEVEDMYYRLDRDLADFLTFVFAQVRNGEVLVVFTSDHGTSPSFDTGHEESDRFNTRHADELLRERLCPQDAEQLLPPPFGRRHPEPDARLDRGAGALLVVVGVDVRLRHTGSAGILRRRRRAAAHKAPHGHDSRGSDRGTYAGDHRACGIGRRSTAGNNRFVRI